MRVSVGLFPYDRWSGIEPIVDAAIHADRLGYHGLSMPEHIVWPAAGGAHPLSVVWYDNFVLGATLAGATERIRLLLNACVIPYRHPIDLAKRIATLDVVSRGRVVLVAGTGWLEPEFRLLDASYGDRGSVTDESLRAMKRLWTDATPDYRGEAMHFFPKCAQHPHVPVWIGGNGPRAYRRAVELGDGWSPLGGTLDEVTVSIAELRRHLMAAGRDPAAFTFGFVAPFGDSDDTTRTALRHASSDDKQLLDHDSSSVEQTRDLLGRARAAGVNHVLVKFGWRDPSDYKETIERFATEVLADLQEVG